MRLLRVVVLFALVGAVLTLLLAGPVAAGAPNVGVTKTDFPDPVAPGSNITYTITVGVVGFNVDDVILSDTLPTGTTFVSLTAPAGWTPVTPAVGGTGTVTATIANLGVGNAVFTLVVQVNAGVASGTSISNTATVTTTTDEDESNNSSTSVTSVVAAPTPAPSVPDAATAVPPTTSPLVTFGFAALLLGLLSSVLLLSRRRSAP